ncbi:MAG: S-layer homology domain-containing protein [Bacillota bacterium]
MRWARLVALLLVFLLSTGSVAAGFDEEYAAVSRGLEYLRAAQNQDGGFPMRPGGESCLEITPWVVVALRLAGENPANWCPVGSSPLTYLQAESGKLEKVADYCRTVLAVTVCGLEATDFAGRDLIGPILAAQAENGEFLENGVPGRVNVHCWCILALASAGLEVPAAMRAREWLLAAQNADGGWGPSVGSGSDPDDTAAAIQTLLVLGCGPDDDVLKRATAFLHACQQTDGGLAYGGQQGNVASDAWAVQALLALGDDPRATAWTLNGTSLHSHLLNLQREDGAFAYQAQTNANPVWMTALALPALCGVSYPLQAGRDYSIDLERQDWYYRAVRQLQRQGVLNGYPDGTVRPQQGISRCEFVKLLVTYLGLPLSPARGFEDVKAGHWASPYIGAAVSAGLIQGVGEGRFAPDDPVTGAQVVTMLVRAAGWEQVPASDGKWYEGYLAVGKTLGLLYPGFVPEAKASRAACAWALTQLPG